MTEAQLEAIMRSHGMGSEAIAHGRRVAEAVREAGAPEFVALMREEITWQDYRWRWKGQGSPGWTEAMAHKDCITKWFREKKDRPGRSHRK